MYDFDFAYDCGRIGCNEESSKMVDDQLIASLKHLSSTIQSQNSTLRTVRSKTRPYKI